MITFRDLLAGVWWFVWNGMLVPVVRMFWSLVMWFKRKIEMW